MHDFETRKEAQRSQLYSAVAFSNWLKDQTIEIANCNLTFTEGYRFANPAYGPLTVVGSIGDGGRFNIGGSQLDPNFSDLTKEGALYLASTEKCAIEEAAKPIGKHQLYKLVSNAPLKIWDIEKVIESLHFPNLLQSARADHGERIWGYLKVPTVSQILVSKLRKISGDGAALKSVRIDSALNYCLFFKDDEDVKSKLKVV